MILDKITSLFEGPYEEKYQEPPACFGAAVNNACKMLGEDKVGGRAIMFSSQSSPLGYGKIGARPIPQNPIQLMAALKPASGDYIKLAKWCVENRTAVDLFLFKGNT